MSEKTAQSVVRVVVMVFLLQLALTGFVFWDSYTARINVINAQRDGCERIKLDRISNAEGWRAAEDARRRAGELDIAKRYADLAQDLEDRSTLNCKTVYP